MFRLGHRREGIDDADTIEGAWRIDRGQPPGRHELDEIRAKPLPSGQASSTWEHRIRPPMGRANRCLLSCRSLDRKSTSPDSSDPTLGTATSFLSRSSRWTRARPVAFFGRRASLLCILNKPSRVAR